MSEKKLWAKLKTEMGARWLADRIENRVGRGFADVCYSVNGHHGFIELKYVANGPNDGKFRYVEFFGRQFLTQRRWLIDRGLAGGRCFVLADIADRGVYALWSWQALQKNSVWVSERLAARCVGKLSHEWLIGRIG